MLRRVVPFVAACSYPVFLVALAFGPASSRSQRWGHVLGVSLGPCPSSTTCNPPRKQRLAAVGCSGVFGSSWASAFPLLVVGLVRAVVVPWSVLSLSSSSLVLAAFLFLTIVVPVSLPLFHRGPRPCYRRCPPIPPGSSSAFLAST